jgi:tRNA uridine 5-carboxymethylaminomethyl modification enzyme
MANLKRSAMFSGQISSRGPRYCPSIEDKIYRFNEKPRHHIFLEPEGNGTDEIYPNGFSTSLPEDVQMEAVRTITGLENVEMTQPGYAIEYDYCPSYQIKPSLETHRLPGLFLAGQINGTSGYEEAAGLGLIAGINAVLSLSGEPPFFPDRAESYIGVMLDDLVSHSTTEPYRMFTSRAEYRLRLREDNARDRLIEYARKYDLIPEEDYKSFKVLQRDTEAAIAALEKKHILVSKLDGYAEYFVKRQSISLADILKIPGADYRDVIKFLDNGDRLGDEILERASVAIKYAGYISKQEREVEKFRRNESQKIPADLPFEKLTGLRNEAREKFARFRPTSIGQASRIEGVTVGDIAALSIHVRKFVSQNQQ